MTIQEFTHRVRRFLWLDTTDTAEIFLGISNIVIGGYILWGHPELLLYEVYTEHPELSAQWGASILLIGIGKLGAWVYDNLRTREWMGFCGTVLWMFLTVFQSMHEVPSIFTILSGIYAVANTLVYLRLRLRNGVRPI
jgi:hypothetical protein